MMPKTNTGGVRLMREDIEFKASDGTVLRGWHYRPDEPSAAPHPVIVISHGYGAVKEMALEVFAQQFSGAGLACLVYDHRCFGDSDGQPRQEIAPFVHYAAYEPGSYIDRIAPTPLLMICISQDTITPTDEILHAYRDACEPKRLVLLPGGHCDVYGAQRSAAAEAAAAAGWFHEHLAGQA